MKSRVKSLYLLCLVWSGLVAQTPGNKGKVLLAIFAHPDDEFSVAPVLAKYAAEGVNVYLAVATDGRMGVANTKIPPGDSLAALRKLELQCATEKLGINSPIMLGLQDQFKMTEGNAEFQKQIDTLKNRVKRLLERIKPDAVITWGASGATGHHDHRLVGAVVTEVFETKRWDKPAMLYYAGIPTQKMPPNLPRPIATVDTSFLTVTIPVSDADYAKAKESSFCHKTQLLPASIDGMHSFMRGVTQNTWHFRPHSGSSTPKQTLF